MRKLSDFPDWFMSGSLTLNIVSPDFSRYLDIDKKANKFRIMDTQNQTFVTYVPPDLMKLKKKADPLHIVNRFLFVDSNTIRICNEEGFEKLIHFTDEITENKHSTFTELEFNKIPLFNERERRAALAANGAEGEVSKSVV